MNEISHRVIVYTGMNGFPAKIYLDPNVLLADMRRQFPGANVELVPGRNGDHKIEVTGYKQDNGPLGPSTASFALGFCVLAVEDPQNWGTNIEESPLRVTP